MEQFGLYKSMVNNLLANNEDLIKRFLVLTLIQQAGEASMDNVDELQRLRRKLYKITRKPK